MAKYALSVSIYTYSKSRRSTYLSMKSSSRCHKSLQNPSCVDHIWVSDSKRFHYTSILENDLSDYHDIVVTFLNVEIPKKDPKIINYRCYRLFNDEHFKHDLESLIASNNDLNYNDFDEQFSQLVSKHAPIKYKVVRNNNSPFITKAVRKEIMIRSRFKNIYNKHPSIKNWENFKRQRNKCVTVCRDAKRIYYTSLNMNNIFDNKKFWKTVKPIFSNKCVKDTVQVIVENDQIIREKEHIANIINDHFVNVTNTLNIDGIPHENYNDIKNDIENVIKNYEQHPSIIWIKKHVTTTNKMSFKSIEIDIMKKYIGNLKENKSGLKGAIPPCFLKYYVDVYGEHINKLFEKSIVDEVFPGAMKLADICCIMFDQIYEFIDSKLSPLLSGFRKGFSSQHVLLHMIESWRKDLDKGNAVGALLMDLSKAFDCVDHNLLIAKLHAYGFSKSAIGLLRSYLTNRFQRVGIDGYFSLADVKICNYADDNTLYTYGKQFEEIK
ncbi:uncharacterized protein LOC130648087 [Hydractinia symbiolongicarpus]|uniref:uncharacterized protein LOC130648087 n=1 Tax=Hydractinia symbiolongicarpus TaxID=13093 RepID=UPI00254ABE50|nr:uncharacterized protein LOC130648087 [Hydractinia symbiolongicarpus]